MIMVSKRAWRIIEERKGAPAFHLDLLSYRKSAEKGETPFTPAVSLVSALHDDDDIGRGCGKEGEKA